MCMSMAGINSIYCSRSSKCAVLSTVDSSIPQYNLQKCAGFRYFWMGHLLLRWIYLMKVAQIGRWEQKLSFPNDSLHPPVLQDRQKTPAKRTIHRGPTRNPRLNVSVPAVLDQHRLRAAHWIHRVWGSEYLVGLSCALRSMECVCVCTRKSANCPSLFISFINILFPFFILASFACASKARYFATHVIRWIFAHHHFSAYIHFIELNPLSRRRYRATSAHSHTGPHQPDPTVRLGWPPTGVNERKRRE